MNKGWETNIIFDRLRLFKNLIIDSDANSFVNDMRYRVYSNILTSIADGSKKQAELGDARKVLDYINELESVFKEEINIGGSKVQADIVPPD